LSNLAKQWLWALWWLIVTTALLLLGIGLNLPWVAFPAVFTGILIPLTPTSWRDYG
jgi:hypothetical protein